MSQNQISNNESKASLKVEALNNIAVSKHQVNVTRLTILLLIFLIGCCCGHLGSQMFINHKDKMQILYVSRSEIMDLEKARLEHQVEPEGRMFFGKINKAIALIRKAALSYEDDYHRLIFVGDNYVEGKNTKSISKIVYEKVINQLGYDRASSMFSYMIFFSGGSVIASYMKQKQEALDQVGTCGAASMLLSMISLLLSKSLGLWMVIHYGVMWLLVPSSIFVFLLLVKTIIIGGNSIYEIKERS